jgi:hypothetical protein
MTDEPFDVEIPARFWRTVTMQEFVRLVHNGGYLNAEQCARLWRMEDFQGSPPKQIRAMVNEVEFDRFLKTVKP